MTKAELMDAAWPELAVEENNLAVQIKGLRRVLGAPPRGKWWIATVSRVGYRLLGEDPSAPPARPEVQVERPSIAVLPFATPGDNAEQAIFADGLADELITTLSKLNGLLVISRPSSFALRGGEGDPHTAASELGVRYLLAGSVRQANGHLRVAVRLLDANTGGTVFAERFDRRIADIFAVQDELALRIANELEVRLTDGEAARLRYRTTTNVEAWTLWQQAQVSLALPPSKQSFATARSALEAALALDPDSAALHARLAFVHWANVRMSLAPDRETVLAAAWTHMEHALALDPENADAYSVRSSLLLAGARFDEAVAAAERAISLAPGSSDVAAFGSWVFASCGRPARALAEIQRALRISPLFHLNHLGHVGNALRLLGRFEEAIESLKSYQRLRPGHGFVDMLLCYAQIGEWQSARIEAAKLLRARPDFTVSDWTRTQFRANPAALQADIAALMKAGLPE